MPAVRLTDLVDRLLELTREGAADWTVVEPDSFRLDLSSGAAIALGATVGDAGPEYHVAVYPPGSDVPVALRTDRGGSPDQRLRDLHSQAKRALALAAQAEGDLAEAVRQLSGAATPGVSSPAAATIPTPEDEAQLFAALAGRWREASAGQVEIGRDGAYRRVGGDRTFRLRLNAIDRPGRLIEVVKEELFPGVAPPIRRQLEVLELDDFGAPTRMDGEVKHDRRPLHYRRVS